MFNSTKNCHQGLRCWLGQLFRGCIVCIIGLVFSVWPFQAVWKSEANVAHLSIIHLGGHSHTNLYRMALYNPFTKGFARPWLAWNCKRETLDSIICPSFYWCRICLWPLLVMLLQVKKRACRSSCPVFTLLHFLIFAETGWDLGINRLKYCYGKTKAYCIHHANIYKLSDLVAICYQM